LKFESGRANEKWYQFNSMKHIIDSKEGLNPHTMCAGRGSSKAPKLTKLWLLEEEYSTMARNNRFILNPDPKHLQGQLQISTRFMAQLVRREWRSW
jgi:hypothetical protein